MSLERMKWLFRHWNGIQFPILPLSTLVPGLSYCWTDNSTHSSLHLVHACTLPLHSMLLILSAECIDIIKVTSLIAIIVESRADRLCEEQSPRVRSPLRRLFFTLYQWELSSNVRGEWGEAGGRLWRHPWWASVSLQNLGVMHVNSVFNSPPLTGLCSLSILRPVRAAASESHCQDKMTMQITDRWRMSDGVSAIKMIFLKKILTWNILPCSQKVFCYFSHQPFGT